MKRRSAITLDSIPVKPPNNKEAEKAAEMLRFAAGSREDEHKQSAQDHRVTAVSQVHALRGLKGKSNLKHTSPTLPL